MTFKWASNLKVRGQSLTQAQTKKSLSPWQRIYVNRSLNMAKITAIGFDMDHTLAPYNHINFENLAFQETLKKFIEADYPEELLKLEFKPDFLIRGLLVDRDRGNLLKVDQHKYVKVAYHGHRKLDKEERDSLYNRKSFKAENFLSIDTFFALSEVQLFVEIVDFMRNNPGRINKSYQEVYQDLRYYIDLSHRDGSIKKNVLKNPELYISRDKHLSVALMRLIDSGKSLFLLTNSMWDYTDKIMNYILEDTGEFSHWREFFEYIIVGSGKPGFFTGSQPFLEVITESNLLKIHQGPLNSSSVYHGGNAQLFQRLTGHLGDEILYIGDHVYGDIIQSKGLFNWRTMLIVEELEREMPKLEKFKDLALNIKDKLETKEDAEEELQRLRSKITANRRQAEKAKERNDSKRSHHLQKENEKLVDAADTLAAEIDVVDQEIKELLKQRDREVHPVWGELMKVGFARSRFADQVNAYACLYSGRASNLRFYSPFKRFTSFHETMPHEQ